MGSGVSTLSRASAWPCDTCPMSGSNNVNMENYTQIRVRMPLGVWARSQSARDARAPASEHQRRDPGADSFRGSHSKRNHQVGELPVKALHA